MSEFDVAQICPNGHVANETVLQSPEFNTEYCDKCGEKTITACINCSAPIRGYLHTPGVVGFFRYKPPGFCHNCGSAFPWTERAMQAAIDIVCDSGNLTAEEQNVFIESVHEIVRDTPKAQVAGSRVARLVKKLGTGTADAVRDILVDVASETAKKLIWPDKP